MKKNEKGREEKKRSANSIVREKYTIAFASVVEALLLLLELYFMLHAEGHVPLIIDIAIIMVVVLFFLVLAVVDLSQKNKEMERKEYEDIYKAQKASYLSAKRYFDDIGARLTALENNHSTFPNEIISAQKAVAKVTINRSKENTDALMNSNDELIQHIFGFEKTLQGNNEELIRQQQALLEQMKSALLEQTKEGADTSRKDLQNQFTALQNKLEQMQQELNALELRRSFAPAAEPVQTAEPIPEAEPMPEPEPVSPAFEDVLEPEEADAVPDLSEDEIDDMLADLNKAVEEESAQEIPAEEILPEPELEPIAEAEPEPVEEEKSPMPELSDDPNHALSPDEIAALFANADAVSAEAEPEPEPAEEEKPPMPELSDDPNHVMTPDEIAALFANV